ncbi:MAG: primosomal protein N', partial [Lachnospiraceae bacterium]
MYAKVIVDISHENVDRPFEYRIPDRLEDKIHVGSSVIIPFGKGSTRRQGYVIELVSEPEFDPSRIKDILEPASEDVPIDSVMIRLAWWMKNTYGSTMISALKTVLPSRTKKKSLEKKVIHRLVDGKAVSEALFEAGRKHQKAKVRVLQELLTEENLPYELVKEKLHVTQNTLSSLERQGLITIDVTRVYRNPVKAGPQNASIRKLSDSQQHIVDQIMQDFDEGQKKTYLIHGITGSGKTEVYIELVAECLKRGKQAIVLIPEIALTYQTVMRFYKRLGDRVSVMNSTLSPGEKYDQCERAKKGDIDIIIGPRSALFTPFPRLGLIIIDEEHEPSYKSETMPKYHARETAKELARLHGASVVLGSATPSLDSYYQAKMGQYTLFHLTERLTGNTLPQVEIADLRKELKEGNRSIFSRKLDQLMEQRLRAGEQTMLFLNRRGYAGFVSCRACGHVMKCPHCDVSLSEHMGGRLVCHYCGYEQPMVHQCPECGSKYILGFKAGTEAIEQKLHERFPSARILRMDGDTTKKKESYEAILSAFSDGQADILLGTQMIVKGHDFPNVTLVG